MFPFQFFEITVFMIEEALYKIDDSLIKVKHCNQFDKMDLF